ncbi:MAG: NADH-quinone oxidoreductase subunit NuoG, partial [Sphingosinicella sp.]
GDAREDWSILRALSDALGKPLPFDSFSELRAKLFKEHREFAQTGLVAFNWAPPSLDAKVAEGSTLAYPVKDFYLTNPIARSSPTLQRCSAELLHGQDFAEAAE